MGWAPSRVEDEISMQGMRSALREALDDYQDAWDEDVDISYPPRAVYPETGPADTPAPRGERVHYHAGDGPEFLTVREVAALLRIGKGTAYKLVETGELPHVRFGEKVIRVPAVELRKWLRKQVQGGDEDAETRKW